MRIDGSFQGAYRELEDRMRALAEADGDVFLPSPEPEAPVQYVLICMEPSLAWARSADQARSRVEAGFRNFLYSLEDFIVHSCVRRYLLAAGQRYHITDLSKGAMPVDRAGLARDLRYDRWYALLEEEIGLIATPDAGIVAVGAAVSQYLRRRNFPRPFTQVLHYSSQAARQRRAGIAGREESFERFKDSIRLEDLVGAAKDTLVSCRVPADIRDEALSRLGRRRLTNSLQQLAFIYKLAFASMRA